MQPILSELTEDHIKLAIRKNFEEFGKILPKDKFTFIEEDEASWLSAFIANPLFNRVVATNTDEHKLPLLINEVNNYYDSKHLPFLWMTWPGVDQPNNLEDYLVESGYKSIGTTTGMALNMENFLTEITPIGGLDIYEVRTKEDFMVFMDVMRDGFKATDEMVEGFTAMNQVMWEQPKFGTNYIATYYKKPVAVSTVIYCAGVAGIYNVCTLEEERGKGIGSAVTIRPLMDAKAKGYQLAILHSSEEGFNVYKKIGFKDYYEIGMYMK